MPWVNAAAFGDVVVPQGSGTIDVTATLSTPAILTNGTTYCLIAGCSALTQPTLLLAQTAVVATGMTTTGAFFYDSLSNGTIDHQSSGTYFPISTMKGKVLVADNFTRADSATSLGTASDGGAWTVPAIGGVWGITSNKAYMVTNGTFNPGGVGSRGVALRKLGSGIHDFSFDTARASTAGWAQVLFQAAADASTGIMLQFDASSSVPQLSYSTGTNTWTVPTPLVPVPSPVWTAWSAGTSTIRIVFNPLTKLLTVYQNGVQKYSAVQSAISTLAMAGQYAGIGGDQAGTGFTFDNFQQQN
jgi:hypothetical protein